MDGETQGRDEGQERERRTVNPEQAREMLGSNEASAIDIRDDEKWRDGHLPGARHCPDRDFDDALEQIDDDQTVIVACENGKESAEVADELRERGVDAVSLEGGMDAWRSDDMPMQPSRDPDEGAVI